MSSRKWDQARGRYADKMRKRGTPLLVTPEEFQAAAVLLAKARRYGMSDNMIADQVDVHDSLPSKVRRGKIKTMHRDTFNKVMSLRPARPPVSHSPRRGKVPSGAKVNSTGTVRRMQALRADGFPGHLLGDQLGVTYEAVAQLAKTTRTVVLKSTRDDVARLYEELSGKTPADFGVPPNIIGKCSTWARRAGYVPRSCWDPDTIDDPAAIPEWTGACGTWIGARAHTREGIPMCPACAPHDLGVTVPGFSASKLRALRERSGLSRASLGELVGVNASTIQYWEEGRSVPEREWKIDKLLSVLDATFEDVTEEEPSE